jgi:hypothetical protein
MELKINEDGSVAIEDGKPIYVHDDGKEIPFDAGAAIVKISNLAEEKDRHYANFQKANEMLALYGESKPEDVLARLKEIENLDVGEAKKALETIKNLDDGDLVKAGQVETVKAEMRKAFQEKENEINASWDKRVAEINGTVDVKNSTIYELMVNSRFASSPTILEKTTLPPDIAANYFSKNFRVEGESADAKVVGYLNGERIFSKEKPGEVADFEEALGVVIDAYPMKDRILKASAGGSGATGNMDTATKSQREFLQSLPPTERLKYIHRNTKKAAA